ncbi:MAG: hypothetical protein HKN04_13160 [Rhodothermaceae bacterium]|nr:hypothetical protein [Rhodothermaceae bacterium]
MYFRLNEIDLYDRFCGDCTADNFYELADGALPVYLDLDAHGEPVLKTSSGRLDDPYGVLYVLHDSEYKSRVIVVRR